jgi:alcohol dehydrogenase (cytochrome c)
MMRDRDPYGAPLEVGVWLLFFALLVPAALVGCVIGDEDRETPIVSERHGVREEAARIELAPAFSADQLYADPEDGWITNGGSLRNQRYSPLDEIDADNVERLRGVWMTDLRDSGAGPKYSGEAQPIVYDGVIYVVTGADDVFAVGVESGLILWQYEANLQKKIASVCCGWTSRGVALGDGKVYVGQLDGKLVALDQKTGRVIWSTQVGRWQEGYTITSAPLYYEGLVITGISGGEFGIRGRVQAYDAASGEEVWRFYTIPGPGEVGHDTWPADNDAWTHGGAPVWQTPAVDPELGLLYFSTGNASPDLDGSKRTGDNLFAASIVALDAETGEYRWHFQQVHHDIWDYDAPSPVILFDVQIDGEERKGLAQASKTGWLYLLDRETGEPLLPIEEKPVPQNPTQKTARTQPIPSYPPFIPHEVPDAEYQEIVSLVRKTARRQGRPAPRVIRAKQMYTPFGKDVTVIAPGPQGGVNWPPVSYNPETEMFYVCAQAAVSGYTRSGEGGDFGSTLTPYPSFGNHPGYLVAIDASTGRAAWQKRWPKSCYSGTITTSGDLVFVGRSSGELQAYHAESGELLWKFQTGAGANTTATTFEHEGKQYVVFYAAGNLFAASAHGDNLWLFSLDGTLGPVAPGGS